MKHTVVALLQDQPATLNRAVSALRRHGLAIESLAFSRSDRPGTNRMIVVVEARDVERAVRQLSRLVDVLHVSVTTATGD